MKQSLIQNDFSGGLSNFEKSWSKGASGLLHTMNIHEDPNYITVNPKNVKVSGTIVTDLVKWGKKGSPWSTDKYFYDDSGDIYKVTSSEVWSLDRAGSVIDHNAAGQGLFVFDDSLYYATSHTIGRKGKLDDPTPAYNDDFLSDGTMNLDQQSADVGSTYTLPTTISETATNLRSFIPTNDPVNSITVNVNTIGTGDWTLTLHDPDNKVLGVVTILNAGMSLGDVNFLFSTPVRITISQTYHFHLTSTVADGKITTKTASDESTAVYKEYFGILIDQDDFHPMTELNGLAIGNEHYIAFWDEITYDPCRVVLPAGYHVRALTKDGEFIVAACWKGTTSSEAQEARLFWWDGISETFSYWKDCSQGLPNAMTTYKNKLLGIYGQESGLYEGSDPFQFIQNIANVARGKTVEVYPGAMTQWNNITYIGVSASTDDTNVLQGVYGYGNLTERLPEVTSYDFYPSTGSKTGTGLAIGMVWGVGSDMYFSWADNGTFGVDKVSRSNDPYLTGKWKSLIFDNANSAKMKYAAKLVISFNPLQSGESITPFYNLNRGSEVDGPTISTVGETRAEFVFNKNFYELEFGFNVTTVNTFPKIKTVVFEFDDLIEERGEK